MIGENARSLAARRDRLAKPLLGPAGNVWMTLDSGERTNLNWPDPAEDYRQIFIVNPSRRSRSLAFDVPVVDDVVHFTIDNPAWDPATRDAR